MTIPFSAQPHWLADFALPENPSGAIIALDLTDVGLWAGRIEHGQVVRSTTEPRIKPEVLDARIAAYLVANGVVDAPSPEVFGELVAVVARGRHALVGHDSSLTMGFEQLRLVRITLDDAIEATVPETNRAHGMVIELAGSDPVDAVLLGPGHDEWPGLWEALTERGFSVLLPGDDFPVTFGGDDQPTEHFHAVAEPQEVRAWADSGANPALVDPADYGLDRFGNPVADADEAAEPAPAPEPDEAPSQPGLRGRVVVLGIVIMLAIGGGAVALAMNTIETHGPKLDAADSSQTSTSAPRSSGPEPEHIDGSVNPADISAARAPMSEYTTPPPPPKSTKRQSEATPGPKPPPPTRHKRRTIPNPIPGLPPIVIG